MRIPAPLSLVLLALPGALVLDGCAGGPSPLLATSGFDLTVTGDSTFQAPDGGQTVTVAVVREGTVEEEASDTVSTTADPSFSLTFPGALKDGESYDVDFWIDTNIGGGTPGTCDPPPLDETWRVAVDSVSGPVTLSEQYGPSGNTNICQIFNNG